MIKKILLLNNTFIILTIAFVFFSCSKDPSVEAPKVSKPVLLAEFKSGDEIIRFEYNSDSTVNRIVFNEDPITQDQDVTYFVKYLPNKKVDELVASNGAKIKISYENNLMKKSIVIVGGREISSSEYTYVSNQLKSTIVNFSSTTPSIGLPFYKFDFAYNSNGNVVKNSMYVIDVLTNKSNLDSYAEFQHDDRINPFALIGDLTLVFWEFANKNNITKQVSYDAAGNILETIETEHSYNSLNYPIKATMKITETGKQPEVIINTFSYK